MKLPGETKVLIPWFDTDGNKNWSVLKFYAVDRPLDSRRMYREIRKFVKHNFGITVSKEWLRNVPIVQNDVLFSPYELDAEAINTAKDQFIEDFIQRMRYEENEDGAHSDSEGASAGEAEVPVCSVQDQAGL